MYYFPAITQIINSCNDFLSVYDRNSIIDEHTIKPENQDLSVQLGLSKVRDIANNILLNSPDLSKKTLFVEAGVDDRNYCTMLGTDSRSVLVFGKTFLQSIGSLLTDEAKQNAFNKHIKKIDELPDNEKDIHEYVEKLSKEKLKNCTDNFKNYYFQMTDEELYFIVRHEILGHHLNDDNKKKLALRLTAAWTTLLFLYNFSTGYPYLDHAILLVLPCLASMLTDSKITHSQELTADLKAVHDSENAQKGARRFLKRFLVFEYSAKKYFELTGEATNQVGVASHLKNQFQFGHPSISKRYSGVL